MNLNKLYAAMARPFKTRDPLKEEFIAAVEAHDAARVRTVLGGLDKEKIEAWKNGSVIGTEDCEHPLVVALEKGTGEIFSDVLDTFRQPNLYFWESHVFSSTGKTLLYRALEGGKRDIALRLADDPGIDPAQGYATLLHSKYGSREVFNESALDRARKSDMKDVTAAVLKSHGQRLIREAAAYEPPAVKSSIPVPRAGAA